MYQVPKQKRLHHGKFCFVNGHSCLSDLIRFKVMLNYFSTTDRHLWKKLLYVSSRRFLPSYEEHCQVGIRYWVTIAAIDVTIRIIGRIVYIHMEFVVSWIRIEIWEWGWFSVLHHSIYFKSWTIQLSTIIHSIFCVFLNHFNVCTFISCFSPYRVAVLDKVTDFLLFLGKLLIVGIVGEAFWSGNKLRSNQLLHFKPSKSSHSRLCTGIFSFFFFSGRIKGVEEATPSLNYYWVPILVREKHLQYTV